MACSSCRQPRSIVRKPVKTEPAIRPVTAATPPAADTQREKITALKYVPKKG